MLDTLERAGFLTRTLDRKDRRSILVESTPVGRHALRQMLGDYFRSIASMADTFTLQEQMALRDMLGKPPSSLSPRKPSAPKIFSQSGASPAPAMHEART